MSATRTTIRDAAMAAIDAQGKPAGLNVVPWQTSIPDATQLPLAEVAYRDEVLEEGDSTGPVRVLRWKVTALVADADPDPQAKLDEICAWIVARVMGHMDPQPAPGVTIGGTNELRSDWNADARAQVVGACAVEFETYYSTSEAGV